MMLEKVDYILKGDYILTMADAVEPKTDGAIAVKDGLILDLDTRSVIEEKYISDYTIGGTDKALMPGLVNTHTHAAMVYFRGMADDLPLRRWLEDHIWPAERRWLGPDFNRDATELACLEMLRAGITAFNDMYFYEDASAASVKRSGMRALLGAGIVDFPTAVAKTREEYLKKAESFIERWSDDDLISPSIAPHAPYTCGPETCREALAMANRYGVPLHTHLAETRWEVDEIRKKYGLTPIEYMDANGLLDGHIIAAHSVWSTEKEIDILAERDVKVAHCPGSNMKLASGIAPVAGMIAMGINVSLGTDGAASNNRLDILCEMSEAAKAQKAHSEDPTALPARTALLMATRWGAEAIGTGDRTGSLERGKLADILVIDLKKPHLTPLYDIYSHMVYSARASDIESVMVNGRLLVDNYNVLSLDEGGVISKAREWSRKIAAER